VKTIALITQKGGVGKTTLAVNLAVASGLRTAVFDLDQQESAAIWAGRRKTELPHVEFLTERRLEEGLKAAERGLFELAIIDTPPAAGPQALTAAQSADLILIPCRPSLVDLDAIRRTAQLVKSLGVPAFVVLNAAPPSADDLARRRSRHSRRDGARRRSGSARERSAYRASWPLGKAVVETEPESKAAQEILELKDWVLSQLREVSVSVRDAD
jgi:chromosome partitioning protein